jgi:hypothetical protein
MLKNLSAKVACLRFSPKYLRKTGEFTSQGHAIKDSRVAMMNTRGNIPGHFQTSDCRKAYVGVDFRWHPYALRGMSAERHLQPKQPNQNGGNEWLEARCLREFL